MGSFRTHFRHRHPVLLPVVHCHGTDHTLRNVGVALDEGADGVFLINHGFSGQALLGLYEAVRAAHSKAWIGANFLGIPPGFFYQHVDPRLEISGFWADDAGFDPRKPDSVETPRQVHEARRRDADIERILYFGGVSFKYKHDTNDISAAIAASVACRPYVDVLTTSGAATGQAPSAEKAAAIRKAIGRHPLAIASGISAKNIHPFLGIVDAFLVASSLAQSGSEELADELDPAKVRELARIIHAG
jgi:hypothetical protein